MKPGDLVRLRDNGDRAEVCVSMNGQGYWRQAPCFVPSGTLAVVLDIQRLGAEAYVMVNEITGYVWLSECEVIDDPA